MWSSLGSVPCAPRYECTRCNLVAPVSYIYSLAYTCLSMKIRPFGMLGLHECIHRYLWALSTFTESQSCNDSRKWLPRPAEALYTSLLRRSGSCWSQSHLNEVVLTRYRVYRTIGFATKRVFLLRSDWFELIVR